MQKICSVNDLKSLDLEILRRKMQGLRFYYRGQADSSWTIPTTLYRAFGDSLSDDEVWAKYIKCYDNFKQYAISQGLLRWKPDTENEDFYLLSTARHLGFNCHLLDWTASLDIAILFACSEYPQTDGALWILSTKQHVNQAPIRESPFDVESPKLICKEYDLIPDGKGCGDFPLGRLRRSRQNGLLSIIPRDFLTRSFCTLLDNEHFLIKILIASEAKSELLEYVQGKGINREFLYGKHSAEEDRALSFITELNKSLKS